MRSKQILSEAGLPRLALLLLAIAVIIGFGAFQLLGPDAAVPPDNATVVHDDVSVENSQDLQKVERMLEELDFNYLDTSSLDEAGDDLQ